MSYINEALKKAQRDRDIHHIKYRGMLEATGKEKKFFRKKLIGYMVLFLIVIVGVITYIWLSSTSEQIQTTMNNEPIQGLKNEVDDKSKRKQPQALQPKTTPENLSLPFDGNAPNTQWLYDRAAQLYRVGRLLEAEKFYKDALRLDPHYVEALNNLGVIYIQKKDYHAAENCFEKAIQAKPRYTDAYYNLACLHSLKGEVKQGLDKLKQAISLNPAVKDWARKDADLANLRGVPDFETLVGGKS